jgi:hypothetical protein
MVDPPDVEVCAGDADTVTAMLPAGTAPDEVEPPPLPQPARTMMKKMAGRKAIKD